MRNSHNMDDPASTFVVDWLIDYLIDSLVWSLKASTLLMCCNILHYICMFTWLYLWMMILRGFMNNLFTLHLILCQYKDTDWSCCKTRILNLILLLLTQRIDLQSVGHFAIHLLVYGFNHCLFATDWSKLDVIWVQMFSIGLFFVIQRAHMMITILFHLINYWVEQQPMNTNDGEINEEVQSLCLSFAGICSG